MSPIRTYRDAWNGAMQHPRHPVAGRPATGAPREAADENRWLDGPCKQTPKKTPRTPF